MYIPCTLINFLFDKEIILIKSYSLKMCKITFIILKCLYT